MRRHGEEGLTLTELLIATIVTAIIIVPISGAIWTGLHTSALTQSRIRQTVGANLLSSYFGPDVQNTVRVQTNATEAAGNCGASARTVGLLLTTVDGPGGASVSYWVGSGANADVLYRRTCNAGVASGPISLLHLVAPVSGSLPNPVTFACAPDCGDATWRSITITAVQSDPLNVNAGQYTTTVSAARRVS